MHWGSTQIPIIAHRRGHEQQELTSQSPEGWRWRPGHSAVGWWWGLLSWLADSASPCSLGLPDEGRESALFSTLRTSTRLLKNVYFGKEMYLRIHCSAYVVWIQATQREASRSHHVWPVPTKSFRFSFSLRFHTSSSFWETKQLMCWVIYLEIFYIKIQLFSMTITF